MANRKITQLQKLYALNTGAQFIAVQNNVTKRIDLDDLTNAIDNIFFDVNTVDGAVNYAGRSEDKDGNLYGKFRRVSGNFWVSGALDQDGAHKGDGSIFKITTEQIVMSSPERVRLDPTGNLSLGGSLHISGDNNTISGFGLISRTSTWLQHPVRIDSGVTGAGQWNFVGTDAAGHSAKFTAVPTVLAPGGGYDSVALSGKVLSDNNKLDSKVEDLAQQIFITSGATNTKAYAIESTGIRMNTDRIGILSGSWIVGSGHLQAALDAGCCDNIELVAVRLGNYVTGFSGVFHATGKHLDDKVDVLSGELLGSEAGAASTGVYTRSNLASLNTYRAHKHTTGVFPCVSWMIANPDYCWACNDNIYHRVISYHDAAANRGKLYLMNLNNNMVSGIHYDGVDSTWKNNAHVAARNRLSSMIWTDVKDYSYLRKRTYVFSTHVDNGFLYQCYLGDSNDDNWGKPDAIGTFKRINSTTLNKDGHWPEVHIVFAANARRRMKQLDAKGAYPDNQHNVTGASYCMYECRDNSIEEDDDPTVTGDFFGVSTSRGGSYRNATRMVMYKHQLNFNGQYYGTWLDGYGLSGSSWADMSVDLIGYDYKGRGHFLNEHYDDHNPTEQTLFQYNALKRRFYVSFEDNGMIHQFTINDGYKGAWSGVNPNDPHRGVNYGGGHLPSWWLAGEGRYDYLAYEQSFKPAAGDHGDPNYHYQWHNVIGMNPVNGDEVNYMMCSNWEPYRHARGLTAHAPLVLPKVGPPIRYDGGPQRQPPFTVADWTSWHETA